MSDIFREVDDALQQEKIEKIWKEYGSTIITAIVILILSTAVTSAYSSWDSSRNEAETARLIQALDSEKPYEALVSVIEDTRGEHMTVGLMTSAALLLEEGKTEEAAAHYKEVAQSRKAPKDIRDLASILYAQIGSEDTLAILKPILSNDKSPWIWHARIEAAVLSAHTDNNYEAALKYLAAFKTATTIPLSLKKRGEALMQVYTFKAQQQSNKGNSK